MSWTNAQVAMRWALHNEGRLSFPNCRSASMRYIGPILYSYHTPIAVYHADYVLVTSLKYSITTANHIRMARRFAAGFEVFEVPYVEGTYHDGNADHLHNLLLEKADGWVKWFKNRANNTHMHDAIAGAHTTLSDYIKRTGAKTAMPVLPLEEVIDDMVRRRDAKWDKFMDPKAVMRRERAAARRDAKRALGITDKAA
jgi:hypothetical protein